MSGHLMVCGAYLDLREGIVPELVVKDRASYLQNVVKRREEDSIGTAVKEEQDSDRLATL